MKQGSVSSGRKLVPTPASLEFGIVPSKALKGQPEECLAQTVLPPDSPLSSGGAAEFRWPTWPLRTSHHLVLLGERGLCPQPRSR